jgi:hypothetical protein
MKHVSVSNFPILKQQPVFFYTYSVRYPSIQIHTHEHIYVHMPVVMSLRLVQFIITWFL